uniref:Uncharacterized protein n=1 Tax=Oryza sativa subsp. japonica TaxID=39947 RepID=Q33AM4_ORYSJ|nr:hypothetical protein LOC_Os10g09229 [Oryza sativa Japonica Group]
MAKKAMKKARNGVDHGTEELLVFSVLRKFN